MHFVILLPKHGKKLYVESKRGKDGFLCFLGTGGIHLHPQSPMLLYECTHTHIHTCTDMNIYMHIIAQAY